jgi:hypothetical protein
VQVKLRVNHGLSSMLWSVTLIDGEFGRCWQALLPLNCLGALPSANGGVTGLGLAFAYTSNLRQGDLVLLLEEIDRLHRLLTIGRRKLARK